MTQICEAKFLRRRTFEKRDRRKSSPEKISKNYFILKKYLPPTRLDDVAKY